MTTTREYTETEKALLAARAEVKELTEKLRKATEREMTLQTQVSKESQASSLKGMRKLGPAQEAFLYELVKHHSNFGWTRGGSGWTSTGSESGDLRVLKSLEKHGLVEWVSKRQVKATATGRQYIAKGTKA